MLKRAAGLLKFESENKSYIKHVLKELLPIALLKINS